MLLLYPSFRSYWFRRIPNLHSTMLLLYLIFLFKTGHIKFIYIPLCFYFIPEHDACYFFSDLFTFHYASTLSRRLAERRSEQCINLHSTMLLLYQKWDWQKLRKTQIYIPLCFYFILPVMHPTVCRKVIYIPLCFYFILRRNPFQEEKVIFTFHYASTLSDFFRS